MSKADIPNQKIHLRDKGVTCRCAAEGSGGAREERSEPVDQPLKNLIDTLRVAVICISPPEDSEA